MGKKTKQKKTAVFPTEAEKTVESLKMLSLETISRPRRPGFGTIGKKIQLLVNMFPVTFSESLVVYHYDVEINPTTTTAVKRSLFNEWVKLQSQTMKQVKLAIFDGQKNLFTPFDLGLQGAAVFELEYGENGKKQVFTIKIRNVATIDLYQLAHYLSDKHLPTASVESIEYPYVQVMVLEVLMRHGPSRNPSLAAYGKGGGVFFEDKGSKSLEGGLQVHFGWSQSIRTALGSTYKQLLLNLDIASTAFYPSGPLTSACTMFFGKNNIHECKADFFSVDRSRALGKFLNGVAVQITYRATGRTKYKIQYIGKEPANRLMIELDQGKISVAEFFKTQYNLNLNHPDLPCAQCGAKKEIWIPIELLTIKPNQRHMGKLGDRQVADMIKVTAVPPNTRKQQIQKGVSTLQSDSEFLKSWGVQVDNQMVSCQGRILDPPKLLFNPTSKSGPSALARDGTWKFDQSRPLAIPKDIKTWGFIVFASERQIGLRNVEGFCNGLFSAFKDLKMNVSRPPRSIGDLVVFSKQNESIDKAVTRGFEHFQNEWRSSKIDIIFCVLAAQGSVSYSSIKFIAETKLDVMTQCCLGKHVRDDPARKKPYYMNLALKVNAKMGGVNTFIDTKTQLPSIGPTRLPTMIIGADVTHPPPGAEDGSIAALVGSIDFNYCEYRASIRMQKSRTEIIQEIDDMTRELFLAFRERHSVFPQRVLFYRDGVSEGQFGEVVLNEVTSLKQMFQKLCGHPVAITFVVINKRHKVRFFATKQEDADQKGNLRAGTVIDNTVVHPFEFDFFLYSHPGLQGTSRPSHYHVLFDENGFNADTLQELTYRLCYLYCRSTRAVSMVPSAYYAHLLAARARCHVDQGRGGRKDLKQVLEFIKRTMYYV